MMKHVIFYFAGFLFLTSISNSQSINFTKHVNPFIGTDGHGHTFPGATLPFGMVQLSPDTRVEGWDACGGYHYSDSLILGFSHTHLSGTGVADYGDILFTPSTGELKDGAFSKKSLFSHKTERASPGYYAVRLKSFNILAELTATKRVGVHRYTFPKTDSANIVIDLVHGLGPDKVIDSKIEFSDLTEVAGYRRSEGWAKDQRIYFVAKFSKPFKAFGIVENDSITPYFPEWKGTNLKFFMRFKTERTESLVVKVGLSSVSIEGARKNLEKEMPGWDFDKTRREAEQAWEKELSKIQIEGGTQEQLTTFYTALYHAMLAPNIFSDVDGKYWGMDKKVHTASGFDMYTVFSLWDTFRGEHPLLTIIDQKRTLDFVKSLLAKFDESGTLPVWELASNETWCMIGYHSVPVIVDAYMKGINNFDAEKAMKAMLASANANRYGLEHYRTHGFIPGEKESESVSKSLEYIYDDWCIAQFAKSLGKNDVAEEFKERSQYFKNVFDASTGFVRARVNGMWATPFDPTSVTFHFTEANSWQYNFFAPHDVEGMMELMGGANGFVSMLDSLFGSSSKMTGREQSDISGMFGQYAQGNEPSHHVAYLYNYAGKSWKTQQTVRMIMDSLFTEKPNGLCGNDDCGQMSAWYVMSALGFYQVCPGEPTYTIGSPLFKKATISLENGKKFVIQANENSSKNMFIQSASLNGTEISSSFFSHDELMNGGTLQLNMASRPNELWGTEVKRSLASTKQIVVVPYIEASGKTFSDSMEIRLATPTVDAKMYFTLDGTLPTTSSSIYQYPVWLNKTTTVKAIAVKEGMIDSRLMNAVFTQFKPVGTLVLHTKYDAQYTAGGDNALIDGIRGGTDFRNGEWQGYHEVDLDAVVDLGESKEVKQVTLGCLQDNNSWIFFPTYVTFSFSDDGKNFSNEQIIQNDISPEDEGALQKEFRAELKNQKARYVRVQAKNIGKCPDWHKGKGDKAWLFVDEIIIQ